MNADSSKPTLREARREAIIEALVAAAETVIARKGYSDATMHDIARQAGCATGTIYLYFKSKEEMFNALVGRHSRALAPRLYGAMEGADNPIEKIKRNTRALLDYFNEHKTFFRIFYTAEPGGRALIPQSLRDVALKDYLEFRAFEGKVLKEAQTAGLVRQEIPAEELLEFMHGLTTATLARWSIAETLPSKEEQFRLLWGFLAGGLGAREAHP